MYIWVMRFIVLLLLSHVVFGRLMFGDLRGVEDPVQKYVPLMNNQHIVMMGNPNMRYQYLALAHVIHTHKMLESNNHPNIVLGYSFKSWIDFLLYSNNVLSPYEYCDCHQEEQKNNVYENRYYQNPMRNLSLSFYLYKGDDFPIRGRWKPGSVEGNDHFNALDQNDATAAWEYERIDDFIINMASQLSPKPSTLILNADHWVQMFMNATERERVVRIAQRSFSRVIWMTTTTHNVWLNSDPLDPIMCAMPGVECLDQSWTSFLGTNGFDDPLHFKPEVYNDLSLQLIQQLSAGVPDIHSALPRTFHHTFVQVPTDNGVLHYAVDHLGLLRRFTMPCPHSAGTTSASCARELKNRRVETRSASQVLQLIGGEDIIDICAYFEKVLRDGALVRVPEIPALYLIDGYILREFASEQAFLSRGYRFTDVIVVSMLDFSAFPLGPTII